MSKLWLVAGAIAGVSLLAVPIEAQRAADGPAIEVTPYVGYLISDDIVSGPLGTSLGTANGPIYGAQLSVPLTPGVALVGNAAYSGSSLRAGAPIVGGFDFGDSRTWVYDGSIQFGVPIGRGALPVSPFVQLGAGGIHRELSVGGVSTKATSVAYHAGLGLDLGLSRNLGLRLLARDYIGTFDFGEAVYLDYDGGTMHNIALSAGLRLAF